MAQQHFDLIVIGAGAAGSTAATTAAGMGKRVALVESDKIGGTCLNYGCDPTKTLLHIANRRYHAQRAGKYGLHIPQIDMHWDQVQRYVQQVIRTIRGGTSGEAVAKLAEQGITVLRGTASFTSPHDLAIEVAHQQKQYVSADRYIVASGSKTLVPPITGLQEAGYITNIEAVSLPSLPRRLAVIGGGPIGIEFAQLFHRFGVQVNVIERAPKLLDKEDRELAEQLCALLQQEGMQLQTDTELQRVECIANGKRLTLKHQQETQTLVVDEVLLAIGRVPNLDRLQLDQAGVKTEKKGIPVDEMLRTNVPHIWAAGDVVGQFQFTHYAYEQGKFAAQNAFADKPQPFANHVIPWVTYTDPTLAHVGKTEEQLREEGTHYKVGRMQFSEVERAISSGHTEGLVKVLVDAQGNLLGGHILGEGADDLLAPLILAMQQHIPAERIASTIFPYPTLSEGVRWATARLS